MFANSTPVLRPQELPSVEGCRNDNDMFKHDLTLMLKGALGHPTGKMGHMTKYLYSSVTAGSSAESGANLWNRVLTIGSDYYYIPKSEGTIVDVHRPYFRNLFKTPPDIIDLGPGNYHALGLKTIPTIQATGAKNYVAFDMNEVFARNAAEMVAGHIPAISSKFIHGDFTKPRTLDVEAPILMMMYGCTLSQFPPHEDVQVGEVNLGNMLRNLGEMVDHKAIMIATIDTNRYNPTNCYIGEPMSTFMRHLWDTAKTIVESSTASSANCVYVEDNPSAAPSSAVIYEPVFENNHIVHAHHTIKPLVFVIDGDEFRIPAGTRIDVGYSERPTEKDIKQAIRSVVDDNGKPYWTVANDLQAGNTVHALVLVGKNVSKGQLARARGEISTSAVQHADTVTPQASRRIRPNSDSTPAGIY